MTTLARSVEVGAPRSARAVVSADGTIEEEEGRRGAELLRAHGELAAYARALITAGHPSVKFLWSAGLSSWLVVQIALVPSVDESEAPRAEVELAELAVAPFGLTPRELDVLTLLAGGLSNVEIGARVGASARTVGTHVERILAKLGQPTRAGAAALAVEQGLVRLPVPGGGRSIEGLTVGVIDQLAAGKLGAASRQRHRARPPRARPYVVGSVFPLTGPAGADGLEMRNGSALAIAEINETGGIAGRPIEQVVVTADVFSAEDVRRAFEAVVAAEVDAITAGYLFAERAACEVAADYGCPFLNAQTSATQISWVRDGPRSYQRIFHVCPPETHYGPGFIRFLDELVACRAWRPPNRRIAFVETVLPSSHTATEETLALAERSGWKVDAILRVEGPSTDWTRPLAVVRHSAPAAVMITHFIPSVTAELVREFVRDPTDTLLYDVYSPSIPEYLERAGEAAEGVLWATVTGTYGDPLGRSFAARYRARYGRDPGRAHAGISYDQIHLLTRAWARVGNPRAFDAVAAELRRLTFRGVNGVYWLGTPGQYGLCYPEETGDPSLGQAHLVLQIQDGEHRVVSPPLYAETRFRLPPWVRRGPAPEVPAGPPRRAGYPARPYA